MSRAGDDGLESLSTSSSEDEIIEVRANSRTATPSNSGNRNGLLGVSQWFMGSSISMPTPAAGSRSGNPRRATSRGTPLLPPPPPRGFGPLRLPQQQQQQGEEAPVIDLTDEPDSPVNRATPQTQQQTSVGRNPRRTNSQRVSPPRLSRSDSTLIGQNASVIDLTMDSPEDDQGTSLEFLRARQRRHHRAQVTPADHLIQMEFIHPMVTHDENRLNMITRQMMGFINADFLGGGRANNMVRNHIPARPPSPKPPMENIPEVRTGFTRNTCANTDEEIVIICPCCNEELAYDPTDSAQSMSTKKRKRAVGEHHFWALKKCGHVYCAECFENRRPSKASPSGAGFRLPPGKTPTSTPNPNEIRCVVENCDTKVAAKTEWVGIFL